jgi:hypothetical protein
MGETARSVSGGDVILSLAVMLNVRAPRRRAAALAALALAVLSATAGGCGARGLFRQFEYDEDIHLSLDGTATIYVNASLAALAALRGADLDLKPAAVFDRERVAALYQGPGIRVVRVTNSRQRGRRFAHVVLEVADIRKLPESRMFSWATVRFDRMGELLRFREDLGASANAPVGNVGWKGNELIGIKLHLPSKIAYHNAGPDNLLRGNILAWEQTLSDRLAGVPLEMEARMEPTSILYRTLWLFLGSMAAAFTMLALIIWWVVKKGRDRIANA